MQPSCLPSESAILDSAGGTAITVWVAQFLRRLDSRMDACLFCWLRDSLWSRLPDRRNRICRRQAKRHGDFLGRHDCTAFAGASIDPSK